MKTPWLVIGDTHSHSNIIKIDRWAFRNGINTVIQVGDFGIHWPGHPCRIYKYFQKRNHLKHKHPTWYTCGGNHDNYDRIDLLRKRNPGLPLVSYAPGCHYVERGAVITIDGHKTLFVGGAVSSDAQNRTEGKGWWRAEAPTTTEIQYALDNVDAFSPDIWITHDVHIDATPYYRGGATNPLSGLDTSDTAVQLAAMYKCANTKPSHWFHGHYHRHGITQLDSTSIIGCGIAHDHHQPAKSGWLFHPSTKELIPWDEI